MTPGVDKEAELLLAKAAEDEAVLGANIPDGPFGFHVQQAVEKFSRRSSAKSPSSISARTISST